MSEKNTKFLVKFLGATMEAMNLKPESFVKIFWNIAFIVAFIMIVNFILKATSHYLGM
ncbi:MULTISPECIES: hypothetical protein [unclassified Acinetobacter]|uniref:hypothetical protein n=1 Tax=unclassified Acinetobacter TaxID=196816 RepID=UPI0015D21160|nr:MULTISPECIES: hypothetical protein [unclassified Acinetobacter]